MYITNFKDILWDVGEGEGGGGGGLQFYQMFFCFSFEKGVTLKGKNLLPKG